MTIDNLWLTETGWNAQRGCGYSRLRGAKTGHPHRLSAFEAQQLCPFLGCLWIDYEKYRVISRKVGELLARFSPTVEHFSMDECFLDVFHCCDWKTQVFTERKLEVKEPILRHTGLVCSLGVSRKYLCETDF